jgi:hypothetical protein
MNILRSRLCVLLFDILTKLNDFNTKYNIYLILLFYIYFVSDVLISIIIDTYDQNKLRFLRSAMIYELYNYITAILTNDCMIMKCHHIFAFITTVLLYNNYKPLYDIIIWSMILMLISNLPFTLSYIKPNSDILKIIWMIVFFICRIYLIFPSVYGFFTNQYILDNNIDLICSYLSIGFYILSCYWFYQMLYNLFVRIFF